MGRRQIFYCYGGLFLLALVLRIALAGAANYPEVKTVRPDTSGYLNPAYSLVESGNYNSTRRPPGLPVLAAVIFKCGGAERALSWVLTVISSFTVLAVCRAGFLYGGHKIALAAGGLYALHPTVLGNVPLLLTDSYAGFFAALQYWFFLEFCRKKRNWGWYACCGTAAFGTLIRPVNSLFILPLIFLLAFTPGLEWRKKLLHSLGGAVLFFAVIFPWMFRNASAGAGFCIDTNTGAMYHQNGAMLLGEVNGRGYEFEKQRILAEQQELFKDTVRFPDEKSREVYRIGKYRELVKTHWPVWLKQQLNYQILLPDLPSFMECLGITSSDRGTMAVIKEQGIMAGVRHYFGEKWLLIIVLTLPLIAVAAAVYLGSAVCLLQNFRNFKQEYMEIFLFAAFAYYYLFLPGAITAPRYQIPALPCLTVMASLVFCQWTERFLRGKKDETSRGGKTSETSAY